MPGIGVDLDRRALAGDHLADVLLLEIRLDPSLRAADQREHADALDRHLTDLKPVGIGNRAVHGRANLGAGQFEPRLVDGSLRLSDRGLLAGSERGMRVGGASTCIGKSRLRGSNFVESILIVGAGREAALQQRRLTRQRVALDAEIGLSAGDVGSRSGRLRLSCVV